MQEYLDLFVDKEYPYFLDKYLNTKTLCRLKYVTQFCGCDYTNLYSPLFLYTRYDHSLVVAHMTWHFTHDKVATIAALFHDIGTPCFAHCIDYVFDDYLNQESSEKKIEDVLVCDDEILAYLKEDNIALSDFKDLSKYPILENRSPRLCCDRLDGVLHTCYIWLHTHQLSQIKEVYDNLRVLLNEDGIAEIGFKNIKCALKFSEMVSVYAKELQGNKDKYVMKYISEVIKLAKTNNLLTIEDLYNKKETDIIDIIKKHVSSWNVFTQAQYVEESNIKPNNFYISFATKKRNVIPLVKIRNHMKRVVDVSKYAKNIYKEIDNYDVSKYAYVKNIQIVE